MNIFCVDYRADLMQNSPIILFLS